MAQLRAKQIKLANAGDLLIGGTQGNGTVLAQGADKTVLKVVAGGLAYAMQAATDVTFADASFTATDVSAALVEAKALAKKAGDDLAAETTRATTAEGNLDTAYKAADTAIKTELDATQTGAGLGADGTYTADSASTYIKTATSLKDADSKLDAAVKAVKDQVDALGSGSITALQAEVDAMETAVGLKADGTFDPTKVAGSAHTTVAAATSVIDAVMAVDAALSAEEAARAQAITDEATARDAAIDAAISQEVTDRDAAIKVADDRAKAEEAAIRTDFAAADKVIDDKLTAEVTRATAEEADIRADFGAADVLLQAELDATQAGAGLAVTGAYEAFTDSNYINSATTLKGADKLLDAAIKQVADDLAALGSGSLTEVQTELDNVEAALGLKADGTLEAFAAGGHAAGKTTYKAAIEAIDASLVAAEADIDELQTQVATLAGLGALHFQGELDGDTTAEELAVAGNNAGAPATGDVFRITTVGATDFAGTGLEVNVGDFIVKTATGYTKFDNTDPTVTSTDGNLVVTGDAHAGYTMALVKHAITSAATGVAAGAITVTGGTDSVLADVTLGFDPSKVNFSSLAQVGTPEDGKFLKWNNTTKQIEYVTAAQLGATVREEEDFTPATAANAAVTLAHVPAGAIQVFINGVKLKKAGYVLNAQTVTLVDSANGYGIETGDTLSVSYSYAG